MPTGEITVMVIMAFLVGMQFQESPKAVITVLVVSVVGWFLYKVIFGRYD